MYAAPARGTLSLMGIEDPDADVAEQRRLATLAEDDERDIDLSGIPLEADPADVAEQREEIPDYDDEDER